MRGYPDGRPRGLLGYAAQDNPRSSARHPLPQAHASDSLRKRRFGGGATVKFFVVTYFRSDDTAWEEHLRAHVDYLSRLLEVGSLRASGPLLGTPQTSSMLILSVASREEAFETIAADPYVAQGAVTKFTVTEWDPMFGAFQTAEHRLALSQRAVRSE
jgi:uncharacterized protein